MTQTTFEGIINALREQKARQEQFCKTIHQAFIDAGECDDFRDPKSYEPPTNRMIDSILEALARDFVSPKQSYEQALENINYWFYELDMMNYQFIEPVGGDSKEHQVVPAYIIHENGTKLPMATPANLYDTLMYCMGHNQQPDTDNRVDTKTELRSSLNVEEMKKNADKMKMWWYLKGIMDDELDCDCELTDTIDALGVDSLDMIMIFTRMDAKYNVDTNAFSGQIPHNMTLAELNDLFYNNLLKEK